MIWLIYVAAAVALGWFTNGWVVAHGLAVMTPSGHWEILGEGWGGVGAILIAGLVVGLVAGLFIGSGFAHLIVSWITRNHKVDTDKIIEKTLALETRETELVAAIAAAAHAARTAGLDREEVARQDLRNARSMVQGLERHIGMLKGRLKGSQLKAACLKKKIEKKHTTDEGDTPKPETV